MNPIRVKFIRDKIQECRDWEVAHNQVVESKKDPQKQKRKSVFDDQHVGNGERVRFLDGVKVLDVGCGGGLLTEVSQRMDDWIRIR